MTDREIEQRLKQEVEACVPDVLERVMAHCDEQKGQVIIMTKKKNIWLKVSALAACLALILGVSLFALSAYNPVASVVTLDVNPSIEMKLNKDARVLEVNALNEDAATVLSGMELEDTNLNTATNAIIGSLLKNGYLHELANAILISVEDDDSARGAKLQENLSKEVNDLLSAASLNAAVLSQYVNQDVAELSDEHHISHGKAALVQQLLAANPSYDFRELSLLSVQELSLLMGNPKNEVKTVTTTGAANDSAYIGKDRALAIALEDAKVTQKEITDLEIDFGYEHGVLVYEVDFDVKTTEYEYDIDAKSGKILHSHAEEDRGRTNSETNNGSANNAKPPQSSNAADIGEEKAKSIALNHAGVTEAEVTALQVYSEQDDGRLEYQVDFRVGNTEYEYEINAADGKILDFDKDVKNHGSTAPKPTANNSQSSTAQITEAEAKAIALNHAGVSEGEVSGLRIKQERDDGRLEYQVEFRVGNVEYEYEINAENGKILDYDKDIDD